MPAMSPLDESLLAELEEEVMASEGLDEPLLEEADGMTMEENDVSRELSMWLSYGQAYQSLQPLQSWKTPLTVPCHLL